MRWTAALPSSRRDRRTLLVGGVTIALLVGITRGIPALRHHQVNLRADAAQRAAEAERAEAAVRAHPAMKETLAARAAILAGLDSAFVAGDSPAAAAATLAELVSEAAAVAAANLTGMQVRSDSAAPSSFTRVGVRASVTGDLRAITAFLTTLERGPALVRMTELAISQPEAGIPQTRIETLRVDAQIEALARNPRARAAGGRR